MRTHHSALALVAASAAVLAACGSGGSSTALNGLSPRQATLQAFQKSQSSSLKYDLDGKVTVDASKLQNAPPDIVSQITRTLGGGDGLTLSGSAEQESPQRVRLTLNLKPLVSQEVTAVTYDGTFYYSLDGGRTFGSGGSLAQVTGGFSVTPDQSQKLFDGLPDSAFSDKGSTSIDGLTAEHYTAQVTKDQLFQALAGGTATAGSQSDQNLQLIEQFITVGNSSVDAYVRTDNGQLDRYAINFSFGFDLGKLVQAFSGSLGSSSASSSLPSGILSVGVSAGVHFHDYGTAITVQKPTVDPNAPKLPSGLGGLFGG